MLKAKLDTLCSQFLYGLTTAIVFAATPAHGQSAVQIMTVDRPGFRNSTHLVGRNIFQIETGWRFSDDTSKFSGNVISAQPEIRYGATSWLELRLLTESIVLRSPHTSAAEDERPVGSSDLQPGLKIPLLTREHGPRVAAILKTTIPSGHSSQTSHGYEPGAELTWDQKLPDDFSLAGTWNLTRLRDDGFLWQRAASVSLNHDFRPRTKAFAEVYVRSPEHRGDGNDWVSDLAFVQGVGAYTVFDVSAGHSLHGHHSWFVMLGFSVRTSVPR